MLAIKTAQTNFDRYSKQATPLKSLVAPPEIKDDRPLRELVASMRSTAARGAISQAMAGVFGKLSAAPTLKPAASLEVLLQQIKAKQGTGRQATKLAATFDSITPPPEIADATALELLLQKLRDRKSTSETSECLLATVSHIPPLPEQTDIAAFSQVLDLLGAKQRQLKQKSDLCKQTNEELVALRNEFEQWVDDNPVCPTCGNETDSDHLLKHQDHAGIKLSGESRG